jgi:hypothetical protein
MSEQDSNDWAYHGLSGLWEVPLYAGTDGQPSTNMYFMIIRCDLNDPIPGFDKYLWIDYSTMVDYEPFDAESLLDFRCEDVIWLYEGPLYNRLDEFANQRMCLLDYSNPSSGKIIAMDYLYYQFLS